MCSDWTLGSSAGAGGTYPSPYLNENKTWFVVAIFAELSLINVSLEVFLKGQHVSTAVSYKTCHHEVERGP